MTATAAGLGLIALAVAAVGFTLPVSVPVERDVAASEQPSAEAKRAEPSPRDRRQESEVSLQQLMAVCSRDLHKPLFDTPEAIAAKQAARAVATRPLNVQLLATAVEVGRSIAVFKLQDGSIAMGGESESIDCPGGAMVVKQIDAHKVVVQWAGVDHELELPQNQLEGL